MAMFLWCRTDNYLNDKAFLAFKWLPPIPMLCQGISDGTNPCYSFTSPFWYFMALSVFCRVLIFHFFSRLSWGDIIHFCALNYHSYANDCLIHVSKILNLNCMLKVSMWMYPRYIFHVSIWACVSFTGRILSITLEFYLSCPYSLDY